MLFMVTILLELETRELHIYGVLIVNKNHHLVMYIMSLLETKCCSKSHQFSPDSFIHQYIIANYMLETKYVLP